MADLWAQRRQQALKAVEPLAVRMRPRTLDEVAGQRHILAEGKLLRRLLAADRLTSIILHGPPGTGKTTLAEVIARAANAHFERENAAAVGVARIREIIEHARARLADSNRKTILFLDEIHRFTKSQQDVLLGDVERGVITLIGATTENPLFAVNSALVSRSTLLRLEPLSTDDIAAVLRRAIADPERGLGATPITIDDDALQLWAVKSDGDARRALTALEVAVLSSEPPSAKHATTTSSAPPSHDATMPTGGGGQGATPLHITRAIAEESIQQKAAVYDATGDEHYDAISAMIKSIRGSDPDAALYWIARMLEAGEDPRFIARRLSILASEDIGNADPRAIMVAASAWQLVERVGMPECRIIIAQCATYLALAPKSNASYTAIDAAIADVREGRTVAVPIHIKDGNVKKAAKMSENDATREGKAYAYAHTEGVKTSPGGVGIVGTQDYLGVSKTYYQPTDHGYEKTLKERLDEVKRLRGQSEP
jgi:putative ATPase